MQENSFTKWLKEQIGTLDISVVADKLGMSEYCVQLLLNGGYYPSANIITKLMFAFRLRGEDLFGLVRAVAETIGVSSADLYNEVLLELVKIIEEQEETYKLERKNNTDN